MIEIKERTTEPLTDIVSFYESCGYGGGAKEEDKFFLAKESENIVAVVRVSIEEGHPLLRGMFVAEHLRGQGIGSNMLPLVEEYFETLNKQAFVIPNNNLDKFYGQIGFKMAQENECPQFLIDRVKNYKERGYNVFLMKRPK